MEDKGTLCFFIRNHFIRTLRLDLPKNKNTARTCLAADEKLKNNNNVIFEIQQRNSLMETFTSAELHTFFWQTISGEQQMITNINSHCFIFKSGPAKSFLETRDSMELLKYLQKITLKIRRISRKFGSKIIKNSRTSRLNKII